MLQCSSGGILGKDEKQQAGANLDFILVRWPRSNFIYGGKESYSSCMIKVAGIDKEKFQVNK